MATATSKREGRDHSVPAGAEKKFRSKAATNAKNGKLTAGQIFRLVHRVIIIAVTIFYIITSIQASADVFRVLNTTSSPVTFTPEYSTQMSRYLGTGSLRSSPLLVDILGNTTALRADTYYIDATGNNFEGCPSEDFSIAVYGNYLQRLSFGSIKRGTAHHHKFLADVELILPIIDCSFTATARGDPTLTAGFFLVRNITDPESVFILATRFSMQDYKIVEENEEGPVGLSTFTYYNDMSVTNLTHYFSAAFGYPYSLASFLPCELERITDDGMWQLKSYPSVASGELSKSILTARLTGFYASNQQSNIKYQHYTLDTDAFTVTRMWNWQGLAVLHDGWAWPHLIHLVFAIGTMLDLLVLFLVTYQNIRKGKWWIGDAFVSVSTTLMHRGVLIAITWILNKCWTLFEFSIYTMNEISGTQDMFIYPSIIHADLMTFYLCVLSIAGHLLHERIDPVIAICFYEIAFSCRISIIKCFPSVVTLLSETAVADFLLSILPVTETVAARTPMRLWTTHQLEDLSSNVVFAPLIPILGSVIIVIGIALLQKLYRYCFPNQHLHMQKNTDASDSEPMLLQKRSLTLFEIATGAPLQNRYGVVSQYENCRYIKGMKFASADGIFCNGYVIANGKFLIATADLPVIILMKIIRYRFQNTYTYEVSGNTVQQRARLLYPHTISWGDLLMINTGMLT